MGGGCDDIGVLEGRWDDASGDETGDVGHVDDEVGANRVGDLAHAAVVDETAVGRGSGHKDLGAVKDGGLLEHVVINDAGFNVNTVWHGLEVGGDGGNPGILLATTQLRTSDKMIGEEYALLSRSLITVAQMTTMWQIQTHQSVMWLHDGLVDLEIGWRARESLDIDAPLLRITVEGLESTILA